jgi:Spy/CpxP family protein refolding chaperone
MKRVALIIALTMSALTFTALAQNSNGMPPGHQMLASPDAFADGHLAALDKQVGLSAEQKPQLRAVFLEEGKNLFAVFGDATLSDAQKQARIQQLHVITEHKVWGLLTHEQRKMMTEQPASRQMT